MTDRSTPELPNNPIAEQSILGSLLIDRDAIASLADWFEPSSFFDGSNARIYKAIKYLFDQRVPTDFVTLTDLLEKYRVIDEVGGVAYLSSLLNVVPTAVHVRYYAEIVTKHAARRAMINAGSDLVAAAYRDDVDLDEAVGNVRRAVEPFSVLAEDSGFLNADVLDDHAQRVVDRWEGRLSELVIPTGIRTVDYAIHDGFRAGELVIIGGRPGMGKSSMMLQMAKAAAVSTGKIALVASLEMSAEALRNRMICADAGVPFSVPYTSPTRLLTIDQLNQLKVEKERFLESAERLKDVPIAIVDKLFTTDKIRACIEAMPDRFGNECGVVFIDHLDKLRDRVRDTSAEQETAQRTKLSQQLGKTVGVPVVLLAQLNRAVESTKPYIPSLEHLRYSGSIEQDADFVFLLYRRKYYVDKHKLEADDKEDYVSVFLQDQHKVEMFLAKNRNGDVRSIPLGWKPRTMSFHEAAA